MINKTILMTSLIAMTVIIGITANYAIADDVEVIEGTLTDADGDFHLWTFADTDETSTLVITLVCGNTGNPSEELDPFLRVQSPSGFRFVDDGFTECDSFFSSIINYGAGEVEDGCWVTNSRGVDGGEGPYTLTLDLQGPGDITPLGTVDSLDADCPVDEIEVDIDIKPGSDPNSINPRSMGVVPVAILGSDSLDVFDVDVTTLAFGPGGATPVHLNGAIPDDHYEDVNDDGFTDLVTHYVQKEAEPSAPEACLTGALNDGTLIEGCDSVRLPGNK